MILNTKANYKKNASQGILSKLTIRELGESYDRNVRDYWTTLVLRYNNDRWEYANTFLHQNRSKFRKCHCILTNAENKEHKISFGTYTFFAM